MFSTETRAPRVNQCRHMKNIQTPHKKITGPVLKIITRTTCATHLAPVTPGIYEHATLSVQEQSKHNNLGGPTNDHMGEKILIILCGILCNSM